CSPLPLHDALPIFVTSSRERAGHPTGRNDAMAMTDRVKDELSRCDVTRTCCRKAEVASLLRFSGGLHKVGRQIVVEAELDTASAARRVRKDIIDLYGYETVIMQLAAGGLRRGSRFFVLCSKVVHAFARKCR